LHKRGSRLGEGKAAFPTANPQISWISKSMIAFLTANGGCRLRSVTLSSFNVGWPVFAIAAADNCRIAKWF
jgi:hypothetical protein